MGVVIAVAMGFTGFEVVADYVGQKVKVDMHIGVDGTISLAEAHEISDRVQECVEQLKGV